ncbi:class C sortase [Corynebacterium sp. ES2794-CONJ1]|uniref:class C sortase n=1 Tax=Corynebacterium sp. ES2794-CONJ1 TaxID=2980553 RepID=UPI0021D8D1F9|nr:class C sortase [Corynebacterium sp. ES2794-CONJ1]MCU9518989.1 class C sortase [Corynebacterium sp. ES2794-CONJ1]
MTVTARHRAPHAPAPRKRVSPVSVIFSVIGLILLLYPVVGTIYENSQQSHQVQAYTSQVGAIDEQELAAEIERAREWNAEKQGGPILDPWLQRVTQDNVEYQEYLEQLNLTSVMGRIYIPSIKSDLPIYHGTTETVLSKGIGHLFGSGLPVGGVGNHTVLTGHTGLSVATLWDNLIKVNVGDVIYLDVSGEKMKYQVRQTEIVLPTETDNLRPVPGQDLITLITCTPYGINSHRFLVHAERVPMEPVDEEEFQTIDTIRQPLQWWMYVALAVALIFMILMIREFVKARRDSKKAETTTGLSESAEG